MGVSLGRNMVSGSWVQLSACVPAQLELDGEACAYTHVRTAVHQERSLKTPGCIFPDKCVAGAQRVGSTPDAPAFQYVCKAGGGMILVSFQRGVGAGWLTGAHAGAGYCGPCPQACISCRAHAQRADKHKTHEMHRLKLS